MRTGPSGNKTILIVDDEEPLRRLTSTVLKGSGYTVLEAGDPTEAWRIWCRDREKIDLLFTDVIMPMMSGPEMAREFALMRPGLKIIFTTGSTRLLIRETMDLIPHKRFLEKPYTPRELKDAVSAALGDCEN
jgi:two-component system, cell cycle sensor histidine kinase and response regulator CckA